MITITKIFTFCAAHNLPYHTGKCFKIHGHNYKLEITVKRAGDAVEEVDGPNKGMVVDFGEIKEVVEKEVIEDYDHNLLNSFLENPTAENMIGDIFRRISSHFILLGLILIKIKLWETDTCYAEWIYEGV